MTSVMKLWTTKQELATQCLTKIRKRSLISQLKVFYYVGGWFVCNNFRSQGTIFR